MLTDEELTTRLSAALHDGAPELTYAGPVPHVRGPRVALAATSALAAAAALALTPAALQPGDRRAPEATESTGSVDRGPGPAPVHAVHTLDLGGLRLTDASVTGDHGAGLFYAVGNDLGIPPDAEKVDVGLPVDVYFAANPTGDDPQVYVAYRACPDTNDPCTSPGPRHVYGIVAPGWTREQLMQLLEHPVRTERNRDR
jgi:hypothetical protein